MKKNQIGHNLLRSVAVFTAVGGFLFDWNKTHLFNPRWTPHAKFHDAMTIIQAALLGTGGLYLLQKKEENATSALAWGTILPAFFWTSMAGSFAFPGAKGLEAEFPDKVKRVGGVSLNEGVISAFMLSSLALGYVLAKKNK